MDSIPSIISGGSGNDLLVGGYSGDIISGGLGNDILGGLGGGDLLMGDSGNDAIFGGSGSDLIDGGLGTDKVYGQGDNDAMVYDLSDVVSGAVVGGNTGDRYYRNQAITNLVTTSTPTNIFGGQRPSDFFNWGWTRGLNSPSSTADWLSSIGLPGAGSVLRMYGGWGMP